MSRRAIVALALLAGCASPGPYQGGRVLLQVEASGAVLETLGCVELRVHATTGADAFSDLRELRDEDAIVERFDTDASQMPLLYGLLPEIDEADRSFLVEALAFEGACDADGAPLGMARLLTSYVPGERRIARLRIERGCACPLRFETCDRTGECVAADLSAESLWVGEVVARDPCVTDADCDDHRVCNGVERCGGDGACVPGADAITCTELFTTCSNRAAECVCSLRDPLTGGCGGRIACEPGETPSPDYERCVACGGDAIDRLGPDHYWDFDADRRSGEPVVPAGSGIAGRGLLELGEAHGLRFGPGAGPVVSGDVPLPEGRIDAFTLGFWMLDQRGQPCGAVPLAIDVVDHSLPGQDPRFSLLELAYGPEGCGDDVPPEGGYELRLLSGYSSTPPPITTGIHPTERWRFVVIVVDGRRGRIGRSFDGGPVEYASESLVTVGLGLSEQIHAVQLALGNRAAGDAPMYLGELDELTFFYRALEDQEIRTLFEAPVCRPPEACAAPDGSAEAAPCRPPVSCEAHRMVPGEALSSGAYWVDPDGHHPERGDDASPFRVRCDMDAAAGGWTLGLVQSDDNEPTWTCNGWACRYGDGCEGDFVEGDAFALDRDFGSEALARVPFRDLMLVHRNLSTGERVHRLVYEGVSDGTKTFAEWLAGLDDDAACDGPDGVCAVASLTRSEGAFAAECDGTHASCLCSYALHAVRDAGCGVFLAHQRPSPETRLCEPEGARGLDSWIAVGVHSQTVGGGSRESAAGFGDVLGYNHTEAPGTGEIRLELWLR
ncbi:MAG: fibrinogen-like YCDxxxxGGGW domain-containing protein [Myxococcota bacterium]|nr:fibrinogen-like YCDxxxxGGGW domain-containing protein [Myxococcota bacterium]